jgi:hypothetical protein
MCLGVRHSRGSNTARTKILSFSSGPQFESRFLQLMKFSAPKVRLASTEGVSLFNLPPILYYFLYKIRKNHNMYTSWKQRWQTQNMEHHLLPVGLYHPRSRDMVPLKVLSSEFYQGSKLGFKNPYRYPIIPPTLLFSN